MSRAARAQKVEAVETVAHRSRVANPNPLRPTRVRNRPTQQTSPLHTPQACLTCVGFPCACAHGAHLMPHRLISTPRKGEAARASFCLRASAPAVLSPTALFLALGLPWSGRGGATVLSWWFPRCGRGARRGGGGRFGRGEGLGTRVSCGRYLCMLKDLDTCRVCAALVAMPGCGVGIEGYVSGRVFILTLRGSIWGLIRP